MYINKHKTVSTSLTNGKISVTRGNLPVGMSVRIVTSSSTYTGNDRGEYDILLISATFILVAYIEVTRQYDEEDSTFRIGTSEMTLNKGIHGTHLLALSPIDEPLDTFIPSLSNFSAIHLARSADRWGNLTVRVTAFALA